MIIPDINLLVYAYNADAPFHHEAKRWWENLLNNRFAPVGLPWAVSLGFIRVMTSPKILLSPLYPQEAIHYVQSWILRSNVEVLVAGERHLPILLDLTKEIGTAGPMTTDLHIAALAIEYQAIVHSIDTDFSRFSGLRWINPLGSRGA